MGAACWLLAAVAGEPEPHPRPDLKARWISNALQTLYKKHYTEFIYGCFFVRLHQHIAVHGCMESLLRQASRIWCCVSVQTQT